MLDMMYLNRPLPEPGTLPLSKLLDAWILNAPSARANRNRQQYLVERLNRYCASGARRIASLASGPAREVSTFLRSGREQYRNLDFTLVDFDQEALDYARGHLSGYADDGVSLRPLNANLIKLAGGQKTAAPAGLDLVYCIGFADYVNDSLLVRLIARVFEMLHPGGGFMLGQFMVMAEHPDRAAMEWILDWHLIYLIHLTATGFPRFGPNGVWGRVFSGLAGRPVSA